MDSSTAEYWRSRLEGFSEAELMQGCDGADNWSRSKADFTIGAFKKLCQKHTNKPEHQFHESRELGQLASDKKTVEYWKAKRKERSGL